MTNCNRIYFYFDNRHYRVVDNMVLPFYDYHVDKIEVKITWLFNNKPKLICDFNYDCNGWYIDSLNELISDLKTIEKELIRIDYKKE